MIIKYQIQYIQAEPYWSDINIPSSYNANYHGFFTSDGNTFSTADNRIEVAVRWGISTCDGEFHVGMVFL